jgi:hypothetical protein
MLTSMLTSMAIVSNDVRKSAFHNAHFLQRQFGMRKNLPEPDEA